MKKARTKLTVTNGIQITNLLNSQFLGTNEHGDIVNVNVDEIAGKIISYPDNFWYPLPIAVRSPKTLALFAKLNAWSDEKGSYGGRLGVMGSIPSSNNNRAYFQNNNWNSQRSDNTVSGTSDLSIKFKSEIFKDIISSITGNLYYNVTYTTPTPTSAYGAEINSGTKGISNLFTSNYKTSNVSIPKIKVNNSEYFYTVSGNTLTYSNGTITFPTQSGYTILDITAYGKYAIVATRGSSDSTISIYNISSGTPVLVGSTYTIVYIQGGGYSCATYNGYLCVCAEGLNGSGYPPHLTNYRVINVETGNVQTSSYSAGSGNNSFKQGSRIDIASKKIYLLTNPWNDCLVVDTNNGAVSRETVDITTPYNNAIFNGDNLYHGYGLLYGISGLINPVNELIYFCDDGKTFEFASSYYFYSNLKTVSAKIKDTIIPIPNKPNIAGNNCFSKTTFSDSNTMSFNIPQIPINEKDFSLELNLKNNGSTASITIQPSSNNLSGNATTAWNYNATTSTYFTFL